MSGLRAARHSPSRHAVTGPGRQIRPQLVRAAVLPTLAAGLSGAAAVIFTLQLGGGAGERDARLWPVLTGCALLFVGALAAALLGAQRSAKAVRDRCEALRRSSVRGRQELRTAAERLERGENPGRPVRGGPTGTAPAAAADPAGVDEFWLLAQELRGAREQAHTTLVRLAVPAAPSDSDRKVEVFVNLARRLQSLVHREISLLDDLEDSVEDPDLLKELFHVDHLATRIRRHAENLAVLGGSASRRQWTRPIDLSEVLRSSVAEVEQYTRVKVVPPAGGTVRGHAVADVVHLLAELVENATVFSAPDTDVVVRAERVTAGIAVEVEDRGLGMPAEEQHRMNALLGDPDQVSVRHLLADGRIGLYVVAALARRHGIAVELKSNIYGGVLAVLVLPQTLLGAEAPGAADAAGGSRATSWGTGEGSAVPPLEPVRVHAPGSWPEAERGAMPAGGSWQDPDPGPGAGGWRAETAAPVPAAPAPAWAAPDAAGPAPVPPPPEAGQGAVRTRAEAGYAGVPAQVGASHGVVPAGALAPHAVPSAPEEAGYAVLPAPAEAPDAVVSAQVGASHGVVPAGALAPHAVPSAPEEAGYAVLPAPAEAPDAVVSAQVGASHGVVPAGALAPHAVPSAPEEAGYAVLPAPAEAPDAVVSAQVGASHAVVPADAEAPHTVVPAPAEAGYVPVPAQAAAGYAVLPAPAPVPVPRTRAEPDPLDADRPALPRRRAQQHLAPQLRETPAPRRAPEAEQPVHDPGLMAAFQRGFGLAQSERQA